MRIVVTGTDTGVGKTVFSAALAGALGAAYWKPVQAGAEQPTDSETVASLAPRVQILPEVYRLSAPCSPHRASEIDGIRIDPAKLAPPPMDPMVIEGAGGALVPLTRTFLYADLFASWDLAVVVVARTSLGTINHSLLTIEALRTRGIHILGIAFCGGPQEDSETSIAQIGRVKRLGRLPRLRTLTPRRLSAAFEAHFNVEDFR